MNGIYMVITLCCNWFSCRPPPHNMLLLSEMSRVLPWGPWTHKVQIWQQVTSASVRNLCSQSCNFKCIILCCINRLTALTFWFLAHNRHFCWRGESQSPWWRRVWNMKQSQTLWHEAPWSRAEPQPDPETAQGNRTLSTKQDNARTHLHRQQSSSKKYPH